MGNLIKCKSCGNEVASSATACPKCGARQGRSVWGKLVRGAMIVFFVFVGLIILGIVISTGSKKPSGAPQGGGLPQASTPTAPPQAAVPETATAAPSNAQALAASQTQAEVGALVEKARNAESKKDMRPALLLYEQICSLGEQYGCARAGLIYDLGNARVPKNKVRAASLYEPLCEANTPNTGLACHNLALIYVHGAGSAIPRNLERAAALFDKGCTLGLEESCKASKRIRWDLATDASTLWRAYHSNELAADNEFKGKQLGIVGVISSIRKDFADNVILELRSPNQFMSTSAYVGTSELSKAAALKNGERVLLKCSGDGMVVGTPVLKECSIQDVRQRGDQD